MWKPCKALIFKTPVFLVMLSLCAFATVKTIRDFGGKADGVNDDGPAFQAALDFAQNHPGTTLELGGVCVIKKPQFRDDWSAYVCSRSNLSGLTIANGEIRLGGYFGGLKFTRCQKLHFRNVVFDYAMPIFSQGTIVDSSLVDPSLTVTIDPGYLAIDAEPITNSEKKNAAWFVLYNKNGLLEYDQPFRLKGHEKIDALRSKIKLPDAWLSKEIIHTIQGRTDCRFARVNRAYGGMLSFDSCDDLVIEGCSIHQTFGFAVFAAFCNDAKVSGNRVMPRPGSGNLISACADVFHFIGARRGPLVENNFIDQAMDDNVVISLRGNKVTAVNGNKVNLDVFAYTWYEKGDTLELVMPMEGKRTDYTIRGVSAQGATPAQRYELTLDRPVEGTVTTLDQAKASGVRGSVTLAFNKSWRLPGTVIRGNVFANNRVRSILLGAGDVRIENNISSNSATRAYQLAIWDIYANDYFYYFTTDTVIANNRFINEAGFKARIWWTGDVLADFVGVIRKDIGKAQLMRNITVRDNFFSNTGGIHIQNTDGVSIAGNRIIDPTGKRNTKERYGIRTDASTRVGVTNNVVSGLECDAPVRIGP